MVKYDIVEFPDANALRALAIVVLNSYITIFSITNFKK